MRSVLSGRSSVTTDTDFSPDDALSWAGAERHTVYRAYFDRELGALAVRAGHVCAMMTTADLGMAVHQLLAGQRVPVYSVGDRLWVFIVARPASTENLTRQAADLFKIAVTVAWPGAIIALPTPGNALRQWINGPLDTTPPSFATVVDAVVEATSTSKHR
jgi:hypothetical protein